MNKTVHKIFWVWQRQAEERWLDEMSRQGWQLQKVKFSRYQFVKDESVQYLHRLQFLPNPPNAKQSQAYLAFLQGTGVEVVDAPSNWVYLRRPAFEGPFDVFSDSASQHSHLKPVFTMILLLAVMNTTSALSLLLLTVRTPSVFMIFAVCVIGLMATFLWYGTSRLWGMLQQLKRLEQGEMESKPLF